MTCSDLPCCQSFFLMHSLSHNKSIIMERGQDRHISPCAWHHLRSVSALNMWLVCIQVWVFRPGCRDWPGGDSVAFALLQLYRFNPSFVSWTMAGPSLAAEPGFLMGPLPGEALKGWMHMPSFHSQIRTSQGHRSEVSSSPLRARCLSPQLPHMFIPPLASASFREAFQFGLITREWLKKQSI